MRTFVAATCINSLAGMWMHLATALLATSASLVSAQPIHEISGVGVQSCGDWAANRQKVASKQTGADWNELVYVSWVQGFLSGFNGAAWGAKSKTFGVPGPETITIYLDKYCREHPLDNLVSGSIELMVDLKRRAR